MENEIYVRNCPECGKKMCYAYEDNLKRAIKNNCLCKSCSQTGHEVLEETKKKMSLKKIGKPQLMETRIKNSNINKQRFLDDPSLRKKMSETSKRILHLPNIRKKHVEALSKTRWLGKTFDRGQLELLDKWNKLGFKFEPNYQIHTDDFLCYVDGYDKEKNVVLEYDGKYHNSIGQKQKDLIRQQKIIDILKPKKFWRYNSINKMWINVMKG